MDEMDDEGGIAAKMKKHAKPKTLKQLVEQAPKPN